MDTEARRGNSARLGVAVLLALALVAGIFRVHNLDLGLHARTGEWILEHGEVPDTNVMSLLHTDYPSVHDKWGFQVVAHLVSDGGGAAAVIALRVALIIALFALLWWTARGLGASPGSALLLLVLAIVAARSRFLFRPGLVSLVLLAAVVYLVLVARPDGRRAWWLVPLQLLWVNVHGYFLLGYLTVGAVAFGHLLRGAAGRQTAGRFALLATAMLLTCFLNPSGLEGFLHPFRILADLNAHLDFYRGAIDEFLPTFATDPREPHDRLAFFLLAGLGVGVLLWEWLAVRGRATGEEHETPRDSPLASALLPAIVLTAMFAYMSLTLRRGMAPFAVVVAPLAAAALTARLGPRVPGLWLPTLLALVVGYGEITDRTSVHDGIVRRWGVGLSRIAYADRGIDFIERELPGHRVFTAFRFGSTFTGRRWPQQVASTNGNTHGYPTGYFMDVMDAVSMRDPIAFDRLTDRFELDAALLPMDCRLSGRLLRRDDWRLVRLGVDEAVFVKTSSVSDDWLASHDLELRLRRGSLLETGDLPRTAPCGTVLGLSKACRPTAEIAAAVMLRQAGLVDAARAMAREAAEHDAGDAEAATLSALLEFHDSPDASREVLRQQLERGGLNRFAVEARATLAH